MAAKWSNSRRYPDVAVLWCHEAVGVVLDLLIVCERIWPGVEAIPRRRDAILASYKA